MKKTINGTRYDTDKCKILASYDHRNYSGVYSGTTNLIEASNGQLLVWTDSNGQDGYLQNQLCTWEDWKMGHEYQGHNAIDVFDEIEDEDKMIKLGLIKVCN